MVWNPCRSWKASPNYLPWKRSFMSKDQPWLNCYLHWRRSFMSEGIAVTWMEGVHCVLKDQPCSLLKYLPGWKKILEFLNTDGFLTAMTVSVPITNSRSFTQENTPLIKKCKLWNVIHFWTWIGEHFQLEEILLVGLTQQKG